MDVMKRATDLMNKALDDGSTDNEKLTCALGALRLIKEYGLLGKKHVDVATNILDKIAQVTSPDFVDGVASRAEKIVDGFARVMGSAKKVSDLTRESRRSGPGRRRRRL